MFAARPGQKSPTANHDGSSADKDKDKDDGINYTTVDWREFMCNTWHLEPTLRSVLIRVECLKQSGAAHFSEESYSKPDKQK